VIAITKSPLPPCGSSAVTVPIAPRNSPVPPVIGDTAGGLPGRCSMSSVKVICPRSVSVIVMPGQWYRVLAGSTRKHWYENVPASRPVSASVRRSCPIM